MSSSSSKEYGLAKNKYSPSGMLTTTFEKYLSYVVELSKTLDNLGKWKAIELKHDSEIIILINLHRFPNRSGKILTTYLS